MKKIPTLFTRVYKDHKVVGISDQVTQGCEGALAGKGGHMNAMLIALLVVGLIDIAVCAVCCALDEEREDEDETN